MNCAKNVCSIITNKIYIYKNAILDDNDVTYMKQFHYKVQSAQH